MGGHLDVHVPQSEPCLWAGRKQALWRLLGVNLMPTTGICTFDCLYCENGFNDERRTRDGYVTLTK